MVMRITHDMSVKGTMFSNPPKHTSVVPVMNPISGEANPYEKNLGKTMLNTTITMNIVNTLTRLLAHARANRVDRTIDHKSDPHENC